MKTRDLALLAASCSKFAMATCGVAPGPSAHSCSSRCHCSGLSLIKIESLWFYCIYESIIWLICSCHSNWTPNIHQKVFWILRCAALAWRVRWQPHGQHVCHSSAVLSCWCHSIYRFRNFFLYRIWSMLLFFQTIVCFHSSNKRACHVPVPQQSCTSRMPIPRTSRTIVAVFHLEPRPVMSIVSLTLLPQVRTRAARRCRQGEWSCGVGIWIAECAD